jgi:hypothetical protein
MYAEQKSAGLFCDNLRKPFFHADLHGKLTLIKGMYAEQKSAGLFCDNLRKPFFSR